MNIVWRDADKEQPKTGILVLALSGSHFFLAKWVPSYDYPDRNIWMVCNSADHYYFTDPDCHINAWAYLPNPRNVRKGIKHGRNTCKPKSAKAI